MASAKEFLTEFRAKREKTQKKSAQDVLRQYRTEKQQKINIAKKAAEKAERESSQPLYEDTVDNNPTTALARAAVSRGEYDLAEDIIDGYIEGEKATAKAKLPTGGSRIAIEERNAGEKEIDKNAEIVKQGMLYTVSQSPTEEDRLAMLKRERDRSAGKLASSTAQYTGDAEEIEKDAKENARFSHFSRAYDNLNKDMMSRSQRAENAAAKENLQNMTHPDVAMLDSRKKELQEEVQIKAAEGDAAYAEYEKQKQLVDASYFDGSISYADASAAMLDAEKRFEAADREKKAAEAELYYIDGAYILAELSEEQRQILIDYAAGERKTDLGTGKIAVNGKEKYAELKKQLLAEGYSKEDIEKVTKAVTAAVNRLATTESNLAAAEFAADMPITANVLSVLGTLLGGIAGSGDVLGQKIDNAITGSDAPIDFYTGKQVLSGGSSAVRGATAQNIEQNVRGIGGKVLSFAYQTGMSGLDSVTASFIPGGALFLGSSAANSAMVDAHKRGLSDSQAIWEGIFAGVFESLFENWSIGNLDTMKATPVATLKDLFKNVAKSAGVNFAEEAATEAANIVSDWLIALDESEVVKTYNTYIENGDSKTAAWWKTLGVKLGEVGLAGIGGALMGVVFAGGTGAVNYNANNQTGANAAFGSLYHKWDGTLDMNAVNALIDEGLASGNEDTQNYAKQIQREGKKADDRQLGMLWRMLAAEQAEAEAQKQTSQEKPPRDAAETEKTIENASAEENAAKGEKSASAEDVFAKLVEQGQDEATAKSLAVSVASVLNGEDISGNKAAAISQNPVARSIIEQETGMTIDTARPISEVKTAIREIAKSRAKLFAASGNSTLANSEKMEYTDITNETEDADNGGQKVHLRDGGERNDSASAGRSLRGMEESAGEDQNGTARGYEGNAGTASSFALGRQVTPAELGVVGGSDSATVYLVEGENDDIRAARAEAEARGLEPIFIAGGNMVISDGEARAYISGNRVIVRVDHPSFTVTQLMRHEIGHDKIAKGEIDPDSVRERIKAMYGEESFNEIAFAYVKAYAGTNMTADEIWEEIICDAEGGINIFGDLHVLHKRIGNFLTKLKKETAADTRVATKPDAVAEGKTSKAAGERLRALRKGEMVNAFKDALSDGEWVEYYETLNKPAYNERYFDDGDFAYMTVGGKLLRLEMQRNGEFSVTAAWMATDDEVDVEQVRKQASLMEERYGSDKVKHWISTFGKTDFGEGFFRSYNQHSGWDYSDGERSQTSRNTDVELSERESPSDAGSVLAIHAGQSDSASGKINKASREIDIDFESESENPTVVVGDVFLDTKFGNTIRVVSRDAENTVIEIDTGKTIETKTYTNAQADTLAARDQYRKTASGGAAIAETSKENEKGIEYERGETGKETESEILSYARASESTSRRDRSGTKESKNVSASVNGRSTVEPNIEWAKGNTVDPRVATKPDAVAEGKRSTERKAKGAEYLIKHFTGKIEVDYTEVYLSDEDLAIISSAIKTGYGALDASRQFGRVYTSNYYYWFAFNKDGSITIVKELDIESNKEIISIWEEKLSAYQGRQRKSGLYSREIGRSGDGLRGRYNNAGSIINSPKGESDDSVSQKSSESDSEGNLERDGENYRQKITEAGSNESAFSMPSSEEREVNRKTAVEHFGTTYKWAETGYILADGTRLDFSGKHDGAPGGYRTVDHRDIREALGVDYGGEEYSGGMIQFMNEGNIRVMPETPGIDIGTLNEPTAEQYARIESLVNNSKRDGYFYIDFSNEKGENVGSIEYEDNFNAVRVLNDIRHFFKTGEVREQSDMERFRFSREIGGGKYDYDTLVAKPDMIVTVIDDTVQYPTDKQGRKQARTDIIRRAIDNASKIGYVNEKNQTFVHVKDIEADIMIGKNGLKHGLDRRLQLNAAATINAGAILQNAIRINELTPDIETAKASYVLLGAAKNSANEIYIVEFAVNEFDEVVSTTVLYSENAKKEESAVQDAPESANKPLLVTDSTISIAQLLDFARESFPDVLPASVLQHFGFDERPEGRIGESALYSREIDNADMETLRELNDALREKVADLQARLKAKTEQAKLTSNKNPTKNTDVRFSRETDTTKITATDVEMVRSIGRKSVNAFTSADITKAEKWARKFYEELGVKSPFFRAWFGDWRAHDNTPYEVLTATNTEGKNPRGVFVNADTGWSITSSSVGYDETMSHSGKDKLSIHAMQNIDRIIENAVLLDTEVSEYGRGKKSIYTAFMHKFYSAIMIDGKTYIAKMSVDESYQPGSGDTNKKFYHVRAIKIEEAPSVGIGNSHTPIMEDASSINSISDLFAFVKEYDLEFNPKPVHKALLNDDGTPKVVYHGTSEQFTKFDVDKIGSNTHNQGFFGKGFYFTDNKSTARKYSEMGSGEKNIEMPVYLNMKNPFLWNSVRTKEDLQLLEKEVGLKKGTLKWTEGYAPYAISRFESDVAAKLFSEALYNAGYDGIIFEYNESNHEYVVFDPAQIKSATDNIGTFDSSNSDIRYSREIDNADMETLRELNDALREKIADLQARLKAKTEQSDMERFRYSREVTDIASVTSEEAIQKNIRKVANMSPVVAISGNEFPKSEVDLVTQVDAFFETRDYRAINPILGEVTVDRRSAKDDIAHGIGRTKAAAFSAVFDVIEHGEIVDYQINWKGRGYDTAVLSAPITIGEKPYLMGVVIRKHPETNDLYVHEVLCIEKEDALSFKTGTVENRAPSDNAPSVISILRKIANVKFENSSAKTSREIDATDITAADVDVKYSETTEGTSVITLEDLETLNGIPRKSINKFTSEEITKTEKWARRFYKELKIKSPFFRAWFGDWRAYDTKTNVEITDISRKIIPENSSTQNIGLFLRDKIKKGELFRGNVKNIDTGFDIQIGTFGYNDTFTYAQRELRKKDGTPEEAFRRINALTSIDILIKNAVLLDTEVIADEENLNRSFIHCFYTIARIDGVDELIKIKVDELESPTNPTKRFYNLKDFAIINKEPLAVNWDLNPSTDANGNKGNASATISISDLFAFVKKYDSEFKPKPVNPEFLNDDGTPKVFYHGTDADFTVFDMSKGRANMDIQGSFFSPWEIDAQGYGRNVGKYYLNIKNPADGSTAFAALNRFKGQNDAGIKAREYLIKQGYDGVNFYDEEYVVFYPEQIKSATDNIGTFDGSNPDIRYSREIDNADMETLRELNDALREKVADLQARLKAKTEQAEHWKGQTKRTEEKSVRSADIRDLTLCLLETYGSDAKKMDVAVKLKSLGDYIVRGGDGGLDYADLKDMAIPIAKDIIESASELTNSEDVQRYKELKAYLRDQTLAISEEDGHNIAEFERFRKRNFGRFKVSKTSGIPVDTAYQELVSRFGEDLFPTDITHPADQLRHIAEILDSMQQICENPYSYNMAEAIEYCANDILNALLGENVRQTAPTFADRADAKVVAAKAEGKRKLSELRDEKNAKIDKLLKEGAARTRAAIKKEKQMRDEKLAELRDHYAEGKAKARERKNASALRRKITRHANDLSVKLRRPTDKQHIPESLKATVLTMLDSINLESNYTIDESGKRVKDGSGTPTKRTQAFIALKTQYAQMRGELVMAPDVFEEAGTLDEVIALGNKRIADMNTEELETIWQTVRAVEASIHSANKLLSETRFATVSDVAEALMAENGGKKEKTVYSGPVGSKIEWLRNLTGLDMMTPETYFHLLGDAGDGIFRMMRDAQDKHIRIMHEAEQFTRNLFGDTKASNLEKEMHLVKLGGENVRLSTAHIMELYVLMRREQARGHILEGGILPEPIKGLMNNKSAQTKKEKTLNAIGISTGKDRAKAIRATEAEIRNALAKLTAEQRELADKLQSFLSHEMGEHGNAESMRVYGYRKFGEEFYWPIRSNRQEVKSDISKDSAIVTIGGRSFAKQTKPNANNSVLIGSIFDTFASHVSEMATYASWLGTLEDINRIRNYRFTDESGGLEGTVKGLLTRVFGSKGQAYLSNLLEDISNGVKGTHGETDYMGGLTAYYKIAAVGANLRVVIQQPTALLRALDMIDGKYLAAGLKPSDGWKKALKYAPIAQWKDWGYFDINTGMQMKDVLFGNNGALGRIREGAMWLAGKADSVSWGVLWNACEAEMRDKNKSLTPGTEAFYKAIAERFTEIVDHTQVVDGILQRSQIMRSGNPLTKMSTAFMGEPTKQYNMFMSAACDAIGGVKDGKKKLARTAGALAVAAVLNAAMQSFADAERDDDEEKKYWEKWLEAFIGFTGDEEGFGEHFSAFWQGNLQSSFNPLGYVPIVKDVVSLLQGYDVSRMDMDGIADTITAATRWYKSLLGDNKYTVASSTVNLIAETAKLLGIPAANLKREVMSLVTTIAIESDNYLMQYRLKKWNLRLVYSYNNGEFLDILYAAYGADQDAYKIIYKDMVKHGFDPDKIKDGMEKRMKEEQGVKSVKNLKNRFTPPA